MSNQITIVINGRQVAAPAPVLSFKRVLELADRSPRERVAVNFSKGRDGICGNMRPSEELAVCEGMEFHVYDYAAPAEPS